MVRLSDMLEIDRAHLLGKRCPRLPGNPWVTPPVIGEARIAIVTTAGLHRRDDRVFPMSSAGFRRIPDDAAPGSIVMSHTSHNFDRTGFYEDVNVAFPLDRIHDLVASGEIGASAPRHYAFMGAFHEPEKYEEGAKEAANEMHADGVHVAFLTPV